MNRATGYGCARGCMILHVVLALLGTLGATLGAAGPVKEVKERAQSIFKLNPDGSATCSTGIDREISAFRDRAGRKASLRRSASYQTAEGGISVTLVGFTQEAEQAFVFAVDLLASHVHLGRAINVSAVFEPLPPGVLGAAGPTDVGLPSAGSPAFLPNALLKQVVDSFPGDPDEPDIEASFSSSFNSWYFGLDANPSSQRIDFVSVVLHELVHGLGFIDSFEQSASQGSYGLGSGSTPLIFDTFVADRTGNLLIETFANPSPQILTALTGGNLRFTGSRSLLADSTGGPFLFAPLVFQPGSSVAHWDEGRYPAGSLNALMTPVIGDGEANHNPGPITLGLLSDLGFQVQAAFTETLPLFGTGGGIRSDIVVVNLSPEQSAEGHVEFFDPAGNALDPEGIVQGGTIFVLPPLGSHTFRTMNSSSIVTGSALVRSTGQVSTVIRFDLQGSGIAGVGSTDSLTRAVAPVRREGPLNTGIAIRNTNIAPITLNLTLKDENGQVVANGEVSRNLPVNGRISEFLNELFPDADTVLFSGAICIEVQSGSFAAIAIELEQGRVFTTLPVETPLRIEDPAIDDEDDHGNACASATPVSVGSLEASLEVPGDIDFFRIEVTEHSGLVVSTSGVTDTLGGLWDSGCQLLDFDDDTGSGLNFRITQTLDPGIYYVSVEGFSGTAGPYTLNIDIGAPGPSDDHGDTCSTATPIAAGSTAMGIIEPGDDIDIFRVVLLSPTTLTAFSSGTLDTIGELRSADCSILQTNDDGGSGLNFSLSRQVPAGTYYVAVGSFLNGTGSYTLHVNTGAGATEDK